MTLNTNTGFNTMSLKKYWLKEVMKKIIQVKIFLFQADRQAFNMLMVPPAGVSPVCP